jgi:MFS superfamily sulfate permease-like transporter
VLASLVIVALIQKIHHVTDFLVLFKKSKIEGLVWLVTFVAVIVFDVDIGLYVGLLSNLFIIIIKSQR